MPAATLEKRDDISPSLARHYAEELQERYGDYAFEKANLHLAIAVLECDEENAFLWLEAALIISRAFRAGP